MVAREFAERVHAGQLDRYGVPLLDHVRRVAFAVPSRAQAVAWLHEVFECTAVTDDELTGSGVTTDELNAIELLTHAPDIGTAAYLADITRIVRAPGWAGELARIVKLADLQDRIDHQTTATSSAVPRPPYGAALTLLREVSSAAPQGAIADDRVASAAVR